MPGAAGQPGDVAVATETQTAGPVRLTGELIILFLCAVLLLKTFCLEGYLISTGSMAPGLLGYHKHIVCPTCRYSFEFGTAFDESVGDEGQAGAASYADCPQCGQMAIDVGSVPICPGDQLLVQKHIFELRPPRRWETVVFRNPASPGEAYVKRIAGLPGDELLIRHGDLLIDGRRIPRDLQQLRDMRVLVSDIRHPADSDLWRPDWQFDGNWSAERGELISVPSASGDDPGVAGADSVNDLRFRYWRRHGGSHRVSVPLSGTEAEADWRNFLQRFNRIPVSWTDRISFDRVRGRLGCRGVMPETMQADLEREARSDGFRRAVRRLAALSHLSPVTDIGGYNANRQTPEFPVQDLALETIMVWETAPAAIELRFPVRESVFEIVLNLKSSELRVSLEGDDQILLRAPFHAASLAPEAWEEEGDRQEAMMGVHLELYGFDRRLTVAVNGKPTGGEIDLTGRGAGEGQGATEQPGETIDAWSSPDRVAALSAEQIGRIVTQQNRLGVRIVGGGVRVQRLRVYRDIYYTPGRGRHGVRGPFRVPRDGFFVLGDNSAVSSDSRSWEDAVVPAHLLVGKPFVVHFPSAPGRFRIGGRETSIRIPDFERIRYIR